ncbi:MAG TPA: ABC transporter permease [Vicinamibacteria bacterium]|nr:ABC transporter permease [Vicinamibacteria bacterium]
MLAEVRELFRYSDLLKMLVSRITKNRYKRSALGVVWTLLNPLISMVVLTIAFSTIFKMSVHYPVYLLAGLVCWNFFSQTTVYAMGSMTSGGHLLKRVYVPCTIFGLAFVANGLVNLAISIVPLVVIMVVLGHPFFAAWWFVPIAVLLLAAFCLGVTLLMSTLAVFFGDVADMFQLLLQSWFFLTPIMYPMDIVPPKYQGLIALNPMYHLVELFRVPIVAGQLPAATHLVWGTASAVLVLLLGWWSITRKANEFAYRL